MCGTYELLPFRNLSAQLSRRSVDVHVRRYDARIPGDVEAFKNVLFAFQRHLPVKEQLDLLPRWEYFYERTTGTVGVLKEWLIKALYLAIEGGSTTVTESHLKKTALSLSQVAKMASDNIEGEKELRESESALALLREKLGLATDSIVRKGKKRDEHKSSTNKPKARRARRVGQRKPKRDPVGQPVLEQS